MSNRHLLRLTVTLAAAASLAAPVSAQPVPAPSPVVAHAMSQAVQERLPGTTLVNYLGDVVTLQSVRDAHLRHMASEANASALGSSVAYLSTESLTVSPNAHVPLVPTIEQLPERDPGFKYFSIDYQDFCKAASASLCGYLPAGLPYAPIDDVWSAHGSIVQYVDPLIYDDSECVMQGGSGELDGCRFEYPVAFDENFDPGAPPAATSSAACSNPFAWALDPKGDVHYRLFSRSGARGFTLDTLATCAVKVFVPFGTPEH